MLQFIVRRLLVMAPLLFVIAVVSFIIIELPPGDYMTSYLARLAADEQLSESDIAEIEALRVRFGFDQPVIGRFLLWFGNAIRGDFGYSFDLRKPVRDIVWERMGMTLIVSGSSMLFTWVLAFPIGFYSAVRQHSPGDYLFTFIGFVGLATPNFMLALLLMYFGFVWFGESVGGLFSTAYLTEPWSLAKVWDLLKHLWVPVVVVGTAGTAGLIRVLRNNLLDELGKPYVTTARAKGLPEGRLLLKYPVRIAINPFLSTVGWLLPQLISGATITSVVLNLPTAGSTLLQSLLFQDMYLAGAIVMLMAVLTVLGTLVSDILLAVVDPRIRYE